MFDRDNEPTAPRSCTGRLLARVREALAEAAQAPTFALDAAELRGILLDAAAVHDVLSAIEMAHLAAADRLDLGTAEGATDTAVWWAHRTGQDVPVARRRMTLAHALEASRTASREAMVRGHLAEPQAHVIHDALGTLGAEVEVDVVAGCEKEMVRAAEHAGPRQLRALGKRILEVVAPEVADEQLRRALEDEEARAAERCRLIFRDDGHGTTHLHGRLPTATASTLRGYLLALAAPKHRAAVVGQAPTYGVVPGPQRMGRALVELVERYPADRLPSAGGVTARVVVTLGLDQLLGTSQAPATTSMGGAITAAEARRLACEAGIIPVVLGGRSEVLDQGRVRRFHTPAQRIAIATRDRTCTAEGCDAPPGLCQVHHDDPWARGGRTTVKDGRLLCPKHHRMVHDPRSTVTRTSHGRLVVSRT